VNTFDLRSLIFVSVAQASTTLTQKPGAHYAIILSLPHSDANRYI